MFSRRLSRLFATAFLAVAFVAFAGISGGTVAKAQGYYYNHHLNHHQQWERNALRRHQRAERYWYGNSYALHRHQQRERSALRRHQRLERIGYYGEYGRFRTYRRRF